MRERILRWIAAAIILLGVVGYLTFRMSPWPSALYVRHVMNGAGEATAQALQRHAPGGITAQLNEHYGQKDPDETLDVFYPSTAANTGQPLPAVVWIHGGAWVSGSKEQIRNYIKALAGGGFTTVGVNYSLAPGSKYPTPIRQINAALAYLQQNGRRLRVDPSRLFLAGDSAGAQTAAQLANIISVPSYAQQMRIVPAISRAQLRGMVLYGGIYDPEMLDFNGSFGRFLRIVGWSYFGRKDFLRSPQIVQFSVVRNVTADFPPMFISVGNGDPLAAQSHHLAEVVTAKGIPVDVLFFPDNYEPALPHEYQFNLDTQAARTALDRSILFLHNRTE